MGQRHFFIALMLALCSTLPAQRAVPTPAAPTILEHISDVNKGWQHQQFSALSNNSFTISADRDRIQLHFEQVYQLLVNKNTKEPHHCNPGSSNNMHPTTVFHQWSIITKL
jgi:hypothetical protein